MANLQTTQQLIQWSYSNGNNIHRNKKRIHKTCETNRNIKQKTGHLQSHKNGRTLDIERRKKCAHVHRKHARTNGNSIDGYTITNTTITRKQRGF